MARGQSTKGGADFCDVWVALSDGNSFGPAHFWHGYFCVGAELCRVANVNADGRADLVVTFIKNTQPEPGQGDVWVAQSDGGSFQGARKWHDNLWGADCHLGDTDGDGRADPLCFMKSAFGGGAMGDVWVALSSQIP